MEFVCRIKKGYSSERNVNSGLQNGKTLSRNSQIAQSASHHHRFQGASNVGKGAIGIGITVLLWEMLRALEVLHPTYAPSVLDMVRTLLVEITNGDILEAALITMRAWAIGLTIATLLAVPTGILIGLSRWAQSATSVVVEFLRPIPSVALIPVAILFVGIGLEMKVLIIVFACFWPILFNTRYGVTHVDTMLLETGRVFGLSRFRSIIRIVLPAASPSVATGISIATSIALILAVIGEMVAGGSGLGYYILSAGMGGQVSRSYAGVFAAALLGFLLNVIVLRIRGRLFRWSPEVAR